MDDLISRKALLTELRTLDPPGFEDSIAGKVAIKKIKEAPVVSLNPQWIPVTERLPKPFTPVLVYRKSFGTLPPYIKVDKMVLWNDDTQVWTDEIETWKSVVTHWMPLPEAPKE